MLTQLNGIGGFVLAEGLGGWVACTLTGRVVHHIVSPLEALKHFARLRHQLKIILNQWEDRCLDWRDGRMELKEGSFLPTHLQHTRE